MSYPNPVELQMKVTRTFLSCTNIEQLSAARRFQRMARERGLRWLSPDIRRQARALAKLQVQTKQTTQQAIDEMVKLKLDLEASELPIETWPELQQPLTATA